MQIAIIGAGNVGRALATSLTRAGHDVTVSAVHPEHARETAAESGATAAFDTLAGELGSQIAGKVVVDVSNRPTPNADGPATSIAEELQTKLPAAKVIKAFNTAFASRQAQPQVAGIAPDGFVAGDDETAKQTVLDVVESLGFRPVDAGSLAAARTLEGMAWLNIQRNMAGGTWQDAWVLVGPETTSAATDGDARN